MGEYNKAWIALAMAVLAILEQIFHFNPGISEEWIAGLIAVITAFLVWLVPNRAT